MGDKLIYLDNAATTKPYPEVVEAIVEELKDNWGNASTQNELGFLAKRSIEGARNKIANLVGSQPDEIFFTSGSSEGNAWAIAQCNRCLCSPYEHHNITENPKSIIVDKNYLDNLLIGLENSNIKDLYQNFLLSWMLVNNETGQYFNPAEYGQYAWKAGMKYHCDITQALGHVNIKLHENMPYIDIATASAHKFGGPKGIGFIYFNKDTIPIEKIKPLIYGGGQEKSHRAGTENVPYIVGMAVALDKTIYNMDRNNTHCKRLKVTLLEELGKQFNYDDYYIVSPANAISSTLNVAFRGIESEVLAAMLADDNIIVNTGSACNDGSMKNSAVLEAMQVPEEYIRGPIRFSFNEENTEEDIIYTVQQLKKHYDTLKIN